jgi:hypothetical protein
MMRRIAPGEKRNIDLPDILDRPRGSADRVSDANGARPLDREMSG